MEGYVAEAMHAGALGLSTGLEFKPGREAPTDEIVRLNKVVGRYGGHYTSHMRNRDSSLQDSTEEFLRDHPRGRHEGRDLALQRPEPHGSRAGRLAARGRHDAGRPRGRGARRPGRHDAVPRRARRDGRGSCRRGCWPTAGRRRCKRLRDPRGARAAAAASATATGASSTGASGTASASRRARSTRASRARASPRSRGSSARASGSATSTSWPTSGPAIDSILLIGELFTDEHLAEMISHPLFSLGVDGYTSALDVGLDAISAHPVCFAGHVHYLTHHVRELRHAAARGDDPEDDEHAGGSTSAWPTAGRLAPGLAADVVVLDLDRLDDGSTLLDPLSYVVGRRRGARQRHVRRLGGRAHRGAPRQAPAATVSEPVDLRSDICAGPTDEMWEAMRSARLGIFGDDENVNELELRGAELLGKEAAVFVADLLPGEPRRRARAHPARRARGAPDRAHILVNEGDWLTEIAGLTPVGLDEAETADLICIENTHTRAGGTVVDARRDGVARGARAEVAPRRGTAPERRRRARRAARRAGGAGRHRRAEPQQGALRARSERSSPATARRSRARAST